MSCLMDKLLQIVQTAVFGIPMRVRDILNGVRPRERFGGSSVRRARHRVFNMFVQRFSILPDFGISLGLLEIFMGVET